MTVDQRTDEDAIRQLLTQQAEAWNHGDAEAFAEVFTEDADYVTWVGSHFKGRAAIATSHMSLFEKYLKGTRLDGEITQLRFLTPDVAVIHSKGAVLKGKQRRTRRNTKMQTTVAVRQDGRWLLAAFQNTKYHWLMETIAARFDSRQAPSASAE
ncbi:SgcJ/EcaC family oxidoreductase [Nocardia sp. NBC_00508]|uniref:SgcJ/EcaC family oxidoreductase n=1 Tax=Nocardia sp. NBC_00508 TaxID=2975992 RepID=UPI002E80F98A|nr:SgcJ/EcaC family oxidoreductase [Nocardia sp. NBC_00508]WUD69070.1 SgcJ/EcaC family oxidoreductase [Nocardia sp. NBC_00508]